MSVHRSRQFRPWDAELIVVITCWMLGPYGQADRLEFMRATGLLCSQFLRRLTASSIHEITPLVMEDRSPLLRGKERLMSAHIPPPEHIGSFRWLPGSHPIVLMKAPVSPKGVAEFRCSRLVHRQHLKSCRLEGFGDLV